MCARSYAKSPNVSAAKSPDLLEFVMIIRTADESMMYGSRSWRARGLARVRTIFKGGGDDFDFTFLAQFSKPKGFKFWCRSRKVDETKSSMTRSRTGLLIRLHGNLILSNFLPSRQILVPSSPRMLSHTISESRS